jgi:hypothetical protein
MLNRLCGVEIIGLLKATLNFPVIDRRFDNLEGQNEAIGKERMEGDHAPQLSRAIGACFGNEGREGTPIQSSCPSCYYP